MNVDGPRAPAIAIGAASLAVLMSLIAVVVVTTRSPKGSDLGVVPFETAVAASDIVKLRRDVLEPVDDQGAVIGVRVTDEMLRKGLGLQPSDVIAAIAGKPIKDTADIGKAAAGLGVLDVSVLYVDVVRDGEPIVLRWKLDDSLRVARDARQPSTAASIDLGGNPYSGSYLSRDPLFDTIKKVDDMHYEIPKTTVEKILADPMAAAKGARVVPAMSMGRTEGFKLYAIRPNSLYAAIGLSNGDLLRTVNGFELSSPDKALEIYTKLRDATSLEIELTRRGREETLRIDIR